MPPISIVWHVQPTYHPSLYHCYLIVFILFLTDSFVLDINDVTVAAALRVLVISPDETRDWWIFSWCHEDVFAERDHQYHQFLCSSLKPPPPSP